MEEIFSFARRRRFKITTELVIKENTKRITKGIQPNFLHVICYNEIKGNIKIIESNKKWEK